MEFIVGMPWDCDRSRFYRVVKLAMTALLTRQEPSIRLQLAQEITDLHLKYA